MTPVRDRLFPDYIARDQFAAGMCSILYPRAISYRSFAIIYLT